MLSGKYPTPIGGKMMDFKESLNLPHTGFPMRAQLPQREPEILKGWEEQDLYNLTLRYRQGKPLFVLHDGPPYANGNIHIGTALNKVLKDMAIKYKTMQGFSCPYIPGWDTHGLPIEHQIIKTRGVDRRKISDIEFRRQCREYALDYVSIQREQFKRLGVRGDWENPYLTLTPDYEARQIEIFGSMAEQGFIYKGLKPVYWCTECETALAEAEIEYDLQDSYSIYCRFPVIDDRGILGQENCYCLIWTTTPWTIPANLAIALHPELDYVLADSGSGYYLLAEGLLEAVAGELGSSSWPVIDRFRGSELEGIVCRHPIFERNSPLILADHVTLEQGTGCVHTAPGHGYEDYEAGRNYGLEVLSPLDGRGIFTGEAGEFAGLRYDQANQAVVQALQREGALLKSSRLEHQYPHCWRCKHPVIFRATEQWFASISGFREQALKAVEEVCWYPSWGRERMHNMIADRQDWCISRQRIWGVPIPIFYCRSCRRAIYNAQTFEAVSSLFAEKGSDAWFEMKAEQILPAGFACPYCGGNEFEKEQDTMDVWFDSGSSHAAVCDARPSLRWPADLYLEGSDQYRGWFQSSLLTAVATRRKPPYRAVISHGWVVDGEGKKMSKSLGNVILPEEVIDTYGADILRLWVSSADFTSDVHISKDILKQLSEVYRKIRNTCRFLLGNSSDFDPARDGVDYGELSELDRWALFRLNLLIEKITGYFERYEYHQVFHALHNFCVTDMSSIYLDIIKDRLYCSAAGNLGRRSAQTVLSAVLENLVLLMAPILTFTAEEIWQFLGEKPCPTVQVANWPRPRPEWADEKLGERWDALLQVREEVTRVLERCRQDKIIGGSLEAGIGLWAGDPVYSLLDRYRDQLTSIFIVSHVSLHRDLDSAPAEASAGQMLPIKITVGKAPGHKCPRCWMFTESRDELCDRCRQVING